MEAGGSKGKKREGGLVGGARVCLRGTSGVIGAASVVLQYERNGAAPVTRNCLRQCFAGGSCLQQSPLLLTVPHEAGCASRAVHRAANGDA